MRHFQRLKSWDALAIAFLVTFPFIYYWPVTVGNQVFIGGDIPILFLPVVTELARAFADWRLPLWTTGIEGGYPLFAGGQTGALYPPSILFFALPPANGIALSILFHKAWIALGMYLFCRSWGLSAAAAGLAGLALSMGGFVSARVPHITLVAVASWLPWLLLFQMRYWRAKWGKKSTTGWFILMCLSVAMQFLAGSPPIAFFNIATFFLLGTCAPWIWGEQQISLDKAGLVNLARRLPQSIALTLLSIALGTGLAAIQLLPTAELTSLSNRTEVGFDFFTSFSLEPKYLTQFVAPFTSLGAPGLWTNLEFWGYLGVLPIFVALLAPVLRRDAKTWFLLLFALLALALALGKYNPFYELLYNVPIFNELRAPARFLFLFSFAAALLAGIGFEELRHRLTDNKAIGWATLGIGGASTTLVVVIINLAHSQPLEFWMNIWGWLPALLILLRIENLVLAGWRRISSPVFVTLVLGITLVDLSSFAAPFLTTTAEMTDPAEFTAIPRTVAAMDQQGIYRVYAAKYPPVTRSSFRAALLDNTSLVYGVQAVTSNQNLEPKRNRDYIQDMSFTMRNLINIRYYLSPTEAVPSASPLADRSEPVMGLSLEFLSGQPTIPAMRVAQVELVSFTDQSGQLPDGFAAGELVITKDSGGTIVFPIRVGEETADWAFDALAETRQIKHAKPAGAIAFAAYLGAVGHEFQGHKYVTRYNLNAGPARVTAVGVRSFLPGVQLNVESISLIDEQGHSTFLSSLVGQNNTRLVFKSQTAAMWENQDVMPRAFLVHQAEILDDQTTLKRLKDSDFRPDQLVLLNGAAPADEIRNPDVLPEKDQATISQYESESLTVNTKTDTPAYLVLTDSWYPGWEASVDGRPAPIYRADYMFRAVLLGPGEHVVRFEYHPQSFIWGAVVSGMSAMACLIIAGVSYRRRVGS